MIKPYPYRRYLERIQRGTSQDCCLCGVPTYSYAYYSDHLWFYHRYKNRQIKLWK